MFLEAAPTYIELNDMERTFVGCFKVFTAHRIVITKRLTMLEKEQQLLNQNKKRWQNTLVIADNKILQEQILETLAVMDKTEQTIVAEQKAMIKLQNRIARNETLINDIVLRIQEKKADLGNQLFKKPDPPLWRAFAELDLGASLGWRFRKSIEENMAVIKAFGVSRKERFILFGLATLFILLLVLYTKVIARRWRSDDPHLQSITLLISRPVASTLLIALILTLWIFPYAPVLMIDIFDILLILAVVRLLPQMLEKNLRHLPYVIAVFFFVDRIRKFIIDIPLLERLVFMAEIGVAAGLLFWVFRTDKLSRLRISKAWLTTFSLGGHVALVVFAVSIVAAFFGYVHSAKILSSNVLTIFFYAPIVLYGLFRLFNMLLIPLLHSQSMQSLCMVHEHQEQAALK